MKQATAKPKPSAAKEGLRLNLARRLREAVFILALAIALFLVLALATYHPTDPGWSFSGPRPAIQNMGGRIGSLFAVSAMSLFGYMAYLLP